MRYWLAICLLLCLSLAQGQSLRVGVLPYLSARSLLVEFSPLRDFLAQQLQQDVEILTAADLPRFVQRTQAGDFDLVISAPHFARLAQLEQGFLPLVAIRADFYALLVVPKKSSATTVRALRGKKIHMPHKLSFVSFQIEDFLRQRGLDPERDVQLLYYSTDNNAVLATEQNSDEAGATQRMVFEGMPKEVSGQMRVLGSTQSALSFILLAHPRLSHAQLQQVQAALQVFPYSESGLKFFQTSHSEFVPLDAASLAKLDSYLPRLKSRLEQKP